MRPWRLSPGPRAPACPAGGTEAGFLHDNRHRLDGGSCEAAADTPAAAPGWALLGLTVAPGNPPPPDGPRLPALQLAPVGSSRKAGGPAWLRPVSGSAVGTAGSAGTWCWGLGQPEAVGPLVPLAKEA